MNEVPTLAECADRLDWARFPVLIGAAMARQDDDFYAAWQRGDLFGQTEVFGFDPDGFALVLVAGLPVVRLHYTRLLPEIPMDLAAHPPVRIDGVS